MVWADARKTPPQGVRGVLANRVRTAGPPSFAAQGQSVSRKTVADVPLTKLSFLRTRGRGKTDATGAQHPKASRTDAHSSSALFSPCALWSTPEGVTDGAPTDAPEVPRTPAVLNARRHHGLMHLVPVDDRDRSGSVLNARRRHRLMHTPSSGDEGGCDPVLNARRRHGLMHRATLATRANDSMC